MSEVGFIVVKIYGYNPTSWLLSLEQLRYKKQPTLKLGYPTWISLVCYPIGWIAGKIGLDEELVGVLEKAYGKIKEQ